MTVLILVSFVLRQGLSRKPWLQSSDSDLPASSSKVLEVKACTTVFGLAFCWIIIPEYFVLEVVLVAMT